MLCRQAVNQGSCMACGAQVWSSNAMRLVISMIGTAEYRLAKYLDNFIKPNIKTGWSFNSTTNFMEKIGESKFSEGDELVSFDVCSLYTNVPLEETINSLLLLKYY